MPRAGLEVLLEEQSGDGTGEPPKVCSPLPSIVAASPRVPVLDRHDDFASTVPLAATRVGVRQRIPLGGQQAWPFGHGSPSLVASLQESSQRSYGPALSSTARASSWSSHASLRSVRSCGVPIRPELLPRQDPVPVRNTGRRSLAAPDELIRIFFRLPGEGRIALWVPPDIQVGPHRQGVQDCFTEYWGEDAEALGPLAQRQCPEQGRLTPVRALLAKQSRSLFSCHLGGSDDHDGAEATHQSSAATLPAATEDTSKVLSASSSRLHLSPGLEKETLKGLLEAATGVPVARQKLVFGLAGQLDVDSKALCEYNIGHGATILMSVKPEKAKGRKEPQFLASPKLASLQEPGFILDRVSKFVKGKVGPKKGQDLVEVLPDWQRPRPPPLKVEAPQEQPVYDYGNLHDNFIFDLTGRIRKRFQKLPRIAQAMAAPKHIQARATALAAATAGYGSAVAAS